VQAAAWAALGSCLLRQRTHAAWTCPLCLSRAVAFSTLRTTAWDAQLLAPACAALRSMDAGSCGGADERGIRAFSGRRLRSGVPPASKTKLYTQAALGCCACNTGHYSLNALFTIAVDGGQISHAGSHRRAIFAALQAKHFNAFYSARTYQAASATPWRCGGRISPDGHAGRAMCWRMVKSRRCSRNYHLIVFHRTCHNARKTSAPAARLRSKSWACAATACLTYWRICAS